MSTPKHTLVTSQQQELLQILQSRFTENMHRHKGLDWKNVQKKLASNPKKLWSLWQMEQTGGEPDIVEYSKKADEYIFYDCCGESPNGRRSFCYDQESLEKRKANKPKDSAVHMAEKMGIKLLTEEQYRALQQVEACDLKTSSWLQTPPAIRKLGGAIFGDNRFNQVFVYHNGADSYYAARGFRGCISV